MLDPSCWSQMTAMSYALVQQIYMSNAFRCQISLQFALHTHAMLVPISKKLVTTNVSMAWQTAR